MSRPRSSRGFPWGVMIGFSLSAILLIGAVVWMQPAPVTLSLDPIRKQTVSEQETLTVKPVAHVAGASARSLRYSIVSGPKGAEINPQTGVLTWTPSEAQTGKTHRVEIRVQTLGPKGPTKIAASTKFSIFVEGINEPPIIFEVGELTAVVGEPLMFLVRAADPDIPPKPLEFKFGAAAPAGARLDPVTG